MGELVDGLSRARPADDGEPPAPLHRPAEAARRHLRARRLRRGLRRRRPDRRGDARSTPTCPRVVVKRRLKDVNRFETRSIAEDAQGRVRPHGAPRGRQGLRARLPLLSGRPGLPARAAPEPRVAARVGGADRQGVASASGWWAPACPTTRGSATCMKMLEEYGVEVSISSLRADSLTEDLVASLQRGGHRTLTMAPEAGHRAAARGRSARSSATSSSTRPATSCAATASPTSSATS